MKSARKALRWLVALAVATGWSVLPSATHSVSAEELPFGATLSVLADPVEVAAVDDGTFGAAASGASLRAGDTVRDRRLWPGFADVLRRQ